MKIPGTYYGGAQTPYQTPDTGFDMPGEPLLPYQPTGMTAIPNTYSEHAHGTGPSTGRVPYQQQPSGATAMTTGFTAVHGIKNFGRTQ